MPKLTNTPKRYHVRVTVHIPDDLGLELKQAAYREGLSVSAFAAKALESYLMRRQNKVAGARLLDLIGQAGASPDVRDEIDEGREDDRI